MALIYCKECGKEISDLAEKCPNCGVVLKHVENKKNNTPLIVFCVITVIIIVFCCICCCGGDDTVKNDMSQNVLNTDENETSAQKETIENKNSFNIGETAECNDVQLTVLGYEESLGNEWGEPSDGNVFTYINIEIVNNSKEEVLISSLMSFEGYCDDYKLDFSSEALMAMTTDNMQQLDGSIAPGKKLNGYLGVEVPSDWKVIEMYYKDNVWLDSDLEFVISK